MVVCYPSNFFASSVKISCVSYPFVLRHRLHVKLSDSMCMINLLFSKDQSIAFSIDHVPFCFHQLALQTRQTIEFSCRSRREAKARSVWNFSATLAKLPLQNFPFGCISRSIKTILNCCISVISYGFFPSEDSSSTSESMEPFFGGFRITWNFAIFS